MIEKEGLLANAMNLGKWAMTELTEMKMRHPSKISDIRGAGLLIGVELMGKDGNLSPDFGEAVMYRCLTNGLSFKLTMGSTCVLCPPLIVTKEQLQEAFSILEEAIAHETQV